MSTMESALTIGKVANAAGVGVETIRFYEREGVLPKPKRKKSGYRLFTQDTITQLNLVRKLQDFGFPLSEIRVVIRTGDYSLVVAALDTKLKEIQSFKKEITKLVKK